MIRPSRSPTQSAEIASATKHYPQFAPVQPQSATKKVVVIGDGTVGKTCLLSVYTANVFPQNYVPTVFDNCVTQITVQGRKLNIGLWDTAGQDDYDRLRPLAYPGTDLFLICYAVDNLSTFVNIKCKWYPEVVHYAPGVPVILVGCKTDLRGQNPGVMVTIDQGDSLKQEIHAASHVECSAKAMIDVKATLDGAIGAVLG